MYLGRLALPTMTGIPEIAAAQLRIWLLEPDAPVVVDVREPWEVELCRIPDSVPMPLGSLPNEYMALPSDKPLVIVCHHGVRSRRAAMWLHARGVERVHNLTGGIDAWARDVDPDMRTY